MKKVKKTAIATLAAATLVMSALGLTACQKTKDDGGTPTDGQSSVFTVTFKVNGGAWNTEGTSVSDRVLTTDADGKIAQSEFPANPHRADYTFGGWYASSEGSGTMYTFASKFVADTTLYAKWTANEAPPVVDTTYSITLDANGGTLVGSATATTDASGKLATLPTPPTRTDYAFDGWFTAAIGGTQVTTATEFSGATTIYAHWTYTGVSAKVQGFYIGDDKVGDFGAVDSVNNQVWAYDIDMTEADGGEIEIWYNGAKVTNITLDSTSTSKVRLTEDHNLMLADDADIGNSIINVLYKYNASQVYIQEVVKADIQADDGIYVGGTKSGSIRQNVADTEIIAENIIIEEESEVTIRLGGEDVSIQHFGHDVNVTVSLDDDGKTLTLAAGVYTFYYNYALGSDYQRLWIDGASEGSGGDDQAVEDGIYIVGTDTGWTPLAVNKGVGPTQLKENDGVTVYGNEYKFTVTFTAGAEFKIATFKSGASVLDGWYARLQNDVSSSVATGGGLGNDAPDICVVNAGEYEVYLKIYTAGGHDIWIGRVVGEQTITFDAGDGTLTGAATAKTNKYGQLLTLPDDPTAPTDMRFNGWYTAPTGGTKVSEGDTFETATTLYAQYVDDSTPIVKENGVYEGDTKLAASVRVNPDNKDELMITGLVLDEGKTLNIVYDGEVVTIDKSKSGGTGVTYLADGVSFTLVAGTYDLYYTFGSTNAEYRKLWVNKEVEAPDTDKNAGLTYVTGFGSSGAYIVGQFYSRGMSAFGWGDGYQMTAVSGGYEIKNIYLYAGDTFKVRLGSSDGSGYCINTATAQVKLSGGNMVVQEGGEGYYTITFNSSNSAPVITYHGTTPVA